MSNSAHDDISLIGDDVREQISNLDARNVYELIHDMQVSDELGAAHFMRQNIRLALDRAEDEPPIYVHLQTNMAMEAGWIAGPLGAYFDVKQSECLSKADLEAIKKGDFTMEISLCEEPEAMSLTALMHDMDVFEVGRPSTAADIIKDLIQKSGLISISTERDEVVMTKEGRETYDILQRELDKVATLDWNLEFMSLLALVEAGSLSPDIPILAVFEELYGKEAREALQHLSWSDPEVLYQAPVTASSSGKIAISRKPDKS